MNCKQMESHAITYLDGKLAHKEAAAVARHLAVCADCAERLRAFSDVSSLLDGWAPVGPSPTFNARLQQRILAELAAPASPAGWWDRLALWLPFNSFAKPALAGALLGMILFAVVVTNYTPGTSVSNPQNTALVATSFEGADELALYQDLPVLENLELLSNFEVLQEFQTTTP